MKNKLVFREEKYFSVWKMIIGFIIFLMVTGFCLGVETTSTGMTYDSIVAEQIKVLNNPRDGARCAVLDADCQNSLPGFGLGLIGVGVVMFSLYIFLPVGMFFWFLYPITPIIIIATLIWFFDYWINLNIYPRIYAEIKSRWLKRNSLQTK